MVIRSELREFRACVNRTVSKEIKAGLIALLMAFLLAVTAQAVVPVSPPESRFVWEPEENLTFTWTPDNFYGFYYDAQSRTGKESLTIKLDNIGNRSIPKDCIIYSTTVETATARYNPFGKYSVIGFMGEKYLAGYPAGKSNITSKSGTYLNYLQYISIDDDTSYTLIEGGNLTLRGYVLEVRDVNATGSQVTLSLRQGIEVDTKTIDAGKNYVYEISDGTVIAVHINSVFEEKEAAYVNIKGIFQVSYQYPINEYDRSGMMKITNVSNRSITMRNIFDTVDLKRGSIIEILGGIRLKIADSNNLRVQLYSDRYNEKIEHRGATGSNNRTAWDGLNYDGFWYDIESGNYSESLVITNMTGRRIPEGGLTYTSYIMRVPYAVTKVTGKNIPGTDGSYVTFMLGGKEYMVKNNGFAELLIAHEERASDKKTLVEGETWELGEGYSLTVKSIDARYNPRTALLILKKNGMELDDIMLKSPNGSGYTLPGENGMPKLITYLDAVFAGASGGDMIQLRYTMFVSDNITQIKEGDRLGLFNVTVMEPDRIELKNREPIDLKAGSSINLFGNLSFFVESSDELRFYPTNVGDSQVIPDEAPVNDVPDIPDVTIPVGTSPVPGRTERASGFQVVISLAALIAVYRIRSRRHG
ncbi:S-layer protein [uncultured archaeon]|nr:S-layer protein [uncultured archaeon]